MDNVISVILEPGEDDEGNNFVDKDDDPVIIIPFGSISGSVTELTPDGEAGIGGVID